MGAMFSDAVENFIIPDTNNRLSIDLNWGVIYPAGGALSVDNETISDACIGGAFGKRIYGI